MVLLQAPGKIGGSESSSFLFVVWMLLLFDPSTFFCLSSTPYWRVLCLCKVTVPTASCRPFNWSLSLFFSLSCPILLPFIRNLLYFEALDLFFVLFLFCFPYHIGLIHVPRLVKYDDISLKTEGPCIAPGSFFIIYFTTMLLFM